jgi:molybdate transport system substrate-binding protein
MAGMRLATTLMAAALALGAGTAATAAPVKLLAAGSLKAALSEVAEAFTADNGTAVESDFAPSGLLRKRIEAGEQADVFASANLKYPQAIAEARGLKVRPFAQNRLCALAQPDIEVSPETLLERLLDPAVKVGTSTPKADPSGDYAWALFDKAEALVPGAAARLKAKALQLTGGPDSPKPPSGRLVYAWVMEKKQADIFLTYCTNAVLAAEEDTGLLIVDVPEALAVSADYGLVVLSKRPEAQAFADYILSPDGQSILISYGFELPR